MAGTTVSDAGAVEEAFQGALDEVGLTARLCEDPAGYMRRTMGQPKIDVFTELLVVTAIGRTSQRRFRTAFAEAVERGEVAAMPGSRGDLRRLRDHRNATLSDHRLLPGHP